ncbi:GxxExxY protein [Phenylobacterium sp.]|uniref:GxxExxY protein n=1 Tax=Phenylobacterium sp. TaxID=1871053 RepID=UPI0028A24FDE|nr:GxxExxY protein [Phenylobacterium sp.]
MDHKEHQEHKGLDPRVEAVCRQLLDSAFKVHKALGPGLLETAYEHCLAHELQSRGLSVARQLALPIRYDGLELDAGYRLDLVVERQVVVELKAVEALTRLHEAQVLTYLKLSGHRIGFLMNFNVILLKQGIRRLVL